jgi:hypothetical protein
MAFMTPSENFFNCNSADLFAEFREVLDCSINLLLSNARLGHDPRDGLPGRVMTMVSPRSTSSSNRAKCVLASEA